MDSRSRLTEGTMPRSKSKDKDVTGRTPLWIKISASHKNSISKNWLLLNMFT